jgi:hypothetical protein
MENGAEEITQNEPMRDKHMKKLQGRLEHTKIIVRQLSPCLKGFLKENVRSKKMVLCEIMSPFPSSRM